MTFSSRARRCGTLQTLSVGDGLARKPISDCCVCIMIVMLKGCLGFVVAPEYICIELQYIVGVDHVCIPRPPTTVSPLALESCSRLSGSMAWLETGRLATRVHLIGSRSLSRWHCLPPSQQTDTRIRPFGLCRQCTALLQRLASSSEVLSTRALIAWSECPGAVHRCHYIPRPTVSFGPSRLLRVTCIPLRMTGRPCLAEGSP
jgi:hypothetical protein